MNVSSQIRQCARDGMTVSEIARALGIRYQHAYKVCRDAGLITAKVAVIENVVPSVIGSKPSLTTDAMLSGGFNAGGSWVIEDDRLTCSMSLPAQPGVYAFVVGDVAQYVGVASRSLARRLYGYARPGPTQITNQRVNALLKALISEGRCIDLYYAMPPQLSWNGMPISGAEGLECGLIQTFHLPWNIKGI